MRNTARLFVALPRITKHAAVLIIVCNLARAIANVCGLGNTGVVAVDSRGAAAAT